MRVGINLPLIFLVFSESPCVFPGVTKYPSLTRQECEELIRGLEMGLAVFAAKSTPLSASEIQLKSMLSALRNEVKSHLASDHGSGRSFEISR